MIGDFLALIHELKAHYDEWWVVSALFDWKGNRIEGDKKLNIKIQKDPSRNDCWFYRPEGPERYVFVHMPVVPGVYPDYPLVGGTSNADTAFFRYVPTSLSSVMGGNANVKVDFIVYGYPPKALLKTKKKDV